MRNSNCIAFIYMLMFISCHGQANKQEKDTTDVKQGIGIPSTIPFDSTYKTIHIFVALCDNPYQGIVPVPSKIGNGQDPINNLYWGCAYGIKTYFKNSKEWILLRLQKLDTIRIERLVFKHREKKYYLIADAYDGQFIKGCTDDFLLSACGQRKDTLQIQGQTIGISGNAQLITYIGHDGLMDFQLNGPYINQDYKKRDVIILACYSKHYFGPHLQNANVNPLIWSTGLMSPEAYTLHDAVTGYINLESNESILTRAVAAYAKYQKCSRKAAKNLLNTGW